HSHALAYDSVRHLTVLFGGSAGGAPSDETWEYDGLAWTHRTPAASPPARLAHAMACDAVRARTVLFGGLVASSPANDTWEWDGTTWMPRSPATPPRPRPGHPLPFPPSHSPPPLF